MAFSGIAFALAAELVLRSAAFADHAAIPARFTCEGDDVSPPLDWSAPPPGTKSLALVVDDPDAPDPARPKRVWVHWVVYDLPPEAGALIQGAPLPKGARAGKSDFGVERWRGPCPPIGRHRYFFKLYALDVALGDRGAVTKAELEKLIDGHVLAHTELVGTYERERR